METCAPWLFIIALVLAVFELSRLHGRLARTEAMLARLLNHLNVDFGTVLEPSEAVKRLATDPGTRLEAIKAYRQQTGLGLKPAKAIVEGLASGDRADA